jgi:hypothetical protein
MCLNRSFKPQQAVVGDTAMDNGITVVEYIYTEKSSTAFTSEHTAERRIITGRQCGEFVIYYGSGDCITNDKYLYNEYNKERG